MTVCGIIAEYNPFHNGHLYHIEKSRQLSCADYIIVVLSGSFVQRGAPAFVDKYMRARMALEAGADLVIELPALFSCASAEDFAGAGVSLLDQLGVTDYLSFGTEIENPEYLSAAARILAEEPPEFSDVLNRCLKEGLSFPKAREIALKSCFGGLRTEQISAELSSPNNILALEYLKALYRRQSPIRPIVIPRVGADYHSQNPNEPLCSASAIRTYLVSSERAVHTPKNTMNHTQEYSLTHATGKTDRVRTPEGHVLMDTFAYTSAATEGPLQIPDGMMPAHCARLLAENWQRTCPLLSDDFSPMLTYQLLAEQSQGYTRYLDVSKELSCRILRHISDYRSFNQWTELLKTKQYTYTRVARSLCHILLRIPEQLAETCRENHKYVDYARVLGFRKSSGPLLSAIKKNSSIPMITKMADADAILSPTGKSVLRTELFSSQLYATVQRQKFPSCPHLANDYTAELIII